MQPILGQAKVDKILSSFSQYYSNDSYINEAIMPVIPVKEKTGKFAKYGKDNLRVYSTNLIRPPTTRAVSFDFTVSQGSYSCSEKSLEKLISDDDYKNTDDPYEPRQDATAVATDVIMLNQEYALAQALLNVSVITQNTTLSGTSQWSDYVNSDPISAINTAITTVIAATGKRPNTIAIAYKAWITLKAHPDVRAQVRYTNGGQLSESAFKKFLMDFFDFDEVLVGEAIYNSAQPGQADSISYVWGTNVYVFYKTPKPTIRRATFGATLQDVPRAVDVYREEAKRSDVVRVRHSYDQNIFDAGFMYAIYSAVA